RRNLFLVSKNNRSNDERILGPGALLGLLDFHEPDLPADVRAGDGGHVAADGRWWRQLLDGGHAGRRCLVGPYSLRRPVDFPLTERSERHRRPAFVVDAASR